MEISKFNLDLSWYKLQLETMGTRDVTLGWLHTLASSGDQAAAELLRR